MTPCHVSMIASTFTAYVVFVRFLLWPTIKAAAAFRERTLAKLRDEAA